MPDSAHCTTTPVKLGVDVARIVRRDIDPRQAFEPNVGQRDVAVQIAFVAAEHLQSEHDAVDRRIARLDRS